MHIFFLFSIGYQGEQFPQFLYGKVNGKMGECYLSLVSLTYAYKAKDSLKRRGINSRIVYTPSSIKSNGCGYSLAASTDYQTAVQILRADGIRVLN